MTSILTNSSQNLTRCQLFNKEIIMAHEFFLIFNQTENHNIEYLRQQTEEATKDAKFPEDGAAVYPPMN